MDTDTLYSWAARPREAVAEARSWLLDCFPENEAEIRLLNAASIIIAVEKHYEGGWKAFLVGTDNLKEGV